MRIGELMRDVPKETNNNPNGNNQHGGQNDSGVDSTKNKKKKQKSKSTVIREAGFTPKQAERFQQLASHGRGGQFGYSFSRKSCIVSLTIVG